MSKQVNYIERYISWLLYISNRTLLTLAVQFLSHDEDCGRFSCYSVLLSTGISDLPLKNIIATHNFIHSIWQCVYLTTTKIEIKRFFFSEIWAPEIWIFLKKSKIVSHFLNFTLSSSKGVKYSCNSLSIIFNIHTFV